MYMDMRDYPTLHLDTNVQEQLVVWKDMDVHGHERLCNITLRHKCTGTACSKKGYGYTWTWEITQHYT
jgi:hypothetical protein